jgi:hypothetical protein
MALSKKVDNMRFVALVLLLSMCVFTDEISAGLKVLQSNEKQFRGLIMGEKKPDISLQLILQLSQLSQLQILHHILQMKERILLMIFLKKQSKLII